MAEINVDVRNHAWKTLEEAELNVLIVKSREAGDVVNVAVMMAKAVTRDAKLDLLVCE